MNRAVEQSARSSPAWIGRLREKTAEAGVVGTLTAALNRMLMKVASFNLVHVLLLDAEELRAPPADTSLELRFLTSDEVRRHAADSESELSAELAERIDGGFDLCIAALSEGRLVSYSWLALQSVEAEHAAGAALGLPANVAYLYKAFTHRRFRGRRLYGAITAGALRKLRNAGVTHFVAFVYWNNTAALRACARMGYRRLGLMVVRRGRPVRVPRAAELAGIRFGARAEPLLAARRRRGGRDDDRSIA